MALLDWQQALGRLVEARSAGRELGPVRDLLAGLDLADADRSWLEQVTYSRGFALTSFVPRWWRETRVRRSARLTFAALGDEAQAHLHDYLRAVPNFTLFFVPEGIAFIDYIDAQPVSDVVHAVARFERAMWNVRSTLPAASAPVSLAPDDGPLARHAAAALVRFDAEPALVLAAVLTGQRPPDAADEPHYALVAPGVPGMWRPATTAEALAFSACAPTSTAHALQSLPGVTPALVAALWADRALISADARRAEPDVACMDLRRAH